MAGRRKPRGDDQMTSNEIMALPVPQPVKHREHEVDPYAPAPGAIPGKVTKVVTEAPMRLTRKMTKDDIQTRDEVRREMKMRETRYKKYLDSLITYGGDQERALADIYGISLEEARARRLELQADVRTGFGNTELADQLEANDVALAARINLLRMHAYSANPAASLKSLDMLSELEGQRSDMGTFESFLRIVKMQDQAERKR
jgi:hypothetical protein